MGVLDSLLMRVKRVNDGLNGGKYIREIIEDNEPEIVGMNADQQLYEKGITATGVFIADYAPYSEITIEIKQESGQPYDRVTLRDTGDFEHSFFLDADNEKFSIDAADKKTGDLMKYYGDEILGLTDENAKILQMDIILPSLMQKIRKEL